VPGRDLDRLVQVGALEHVKAGDLLLGLCERAVPTGTSPPRTRTVAASLTG